jgi:hypothetical protein
MSKVRLKWMKESGHTEELCIREMYEAEQKAKTDAGREEHKASLKKLKQTREHERKCIERCGLPKKCES